MENMEHVQVDPLSLHGACPTLLGVKASFLNNLSTFQYISTVKWISNKWIREGAQVRIIICISSRKSLV